MSLPFILALRNGRDTVKLIRPEGSPRPVLGTASPEGDNRRAQIAERLQIGGHAARPKADEPVSIEEPLPQREQTILSHNLPREIRDALNGGVTDALPASRAHSVAGVAVRIKLQL